MTNKDLIMELVNNLEVESKNAEIIAKILDCDICGKVYNVVEVKHGEWEYDCICDMFICSQCGGAMVRNVYPYCSWCGADMRGETE